MKRLLVCSASFRCCLHSLPSNPPPKSDSLRSGLPETSARKSISAKPLRCRQFERPCLRLFPRQHDRTRLRCRCRATPRICARRKFLREIGHHLYAWSFAHTVKVDKDDNIWRHRQGLRHGHQVQSRRRVVLVFGRKQEASDDRHRAAQARQAVRCPPSTACFARSPTLRGTLPATHTSAMATSIPASPKSIRTATGSSPGANQAISPGQLQRPAQHCRRCPEQ